MNRVTVWEDTVVVFDGAVVEVFRKGTDGHRLLLEHADPVFEPGKKGGGYLKLGRVSLQVEAGREADAESFAATIRRAVQG